MHNDYDIAIIGGGLCGVACALTAAAEGRRTLLVERRPALGWESTWAGQTDWQGADSPIARRILQLVGSVGGLRDSVLDGPILEMALDRLIAGAGVDLLLHSYPVRLVHREETALGVVLGSRSGERFIQAGVIVDATEEGLLWRQGGGEAEPARCVPARQAFFMNHAEDGLKLPCDLGGGIALFSSVWRGEVRVEYPVEECSPLAARRALPGIIQRVRAQVPQLRDALVSHVANEPFPASPLARASGIKHLVLGNVLGAGIWAAAADNTPAGRLALGGQVGLVAAAREGAAGTSESASGSVFRPPEITCDVLVVGGGTGGAIAAIAAAREGVQTTLIEASPVLGGMGTGGGIHWYCVGLRGGLQDEVDARVDELTPLFAGKWTVVGFHPEAKKVVLQQMVEEAGVEILLNTVVTGVLLKGGKVRTAAGEPGTALAVPGSPESREELVGLLTATPSGSATCAAQVFIDSTGDGDLAAMAGAPYTLGRDTDQRPHAFSQAAGSLDPQNGSLRFFNFDAGYVDPTDVEDMSRARRLGIQLYWRERFTDQDRLLSIAPLLGLRQGRQILGEYLLTLADEIVGRRFEDAVSFMQSFYDNHSFDYESESDEAAFWVWGLGSWQQRIGCEIPYRCLLPRGVDRLLLACRALSMTFDAHAAFRMQRDIQRIGEAAGLAAAEAVRQGILPREVDVSALQPRLKERGLLADQYRPQPAIATAQHLELPSLSQATPEQSRDLLWLAALSGEEGVSMLQQALSSADPNLRFQASVALALRGSGDGVAELLRHLQERTAEMTPGYKGVPRWQAVIPFLGMAKDARAVPALLDVLTDPAAPLNALVGAVRALGRIGDPSVRDALHALRARENLPTQVTLQVSMGGVVQPAVEDARWQLDLVVAEALARLGEAQEKLAVIAEPYLSDDRAYVRRYAAKVLREAR